MESVQNRSIQYEWLSDIGRGLLLEIYGTRENFVNGRHIIYENDEPTTGLIEDIHPLESYIISYDENMENEGIVISIGERVGFNLDYDDTGAYEPAEQFYDRCSYTIRYNTSSNISKIMDMSEEEFSNHIGNYGFKSNNEIYLDRLNIDSNKYMKSLIQAYLDEEGEDEEDEEDITSNIVDITHPVKILDNDPEDEEDDINDKSEFIYPNEDDEEQEELDGEITDDE